MQASTFRGVNVGTCKDRRPLQKLSTQQRSSNGWAGGSRRGCLWKLLPSKPTAPQTTAPALDSILLWPYDGWTTALNGWMRSGDRDGDGCRNSGAANSLCPCAISPAAGTWHAAQRAGRGSRCRSTTGKGSDVAPFSPPAAPPVDPFAEKTVYKDNLFDKAMIYYFSNVMSKQLGGACLPQRCCAWQ
jgi:hypothetical protein